MSRLRTWFHKIVADEVQHHLASLAAELGVARQSALADVVALRSQISDHLAEIEAQVIHILGRADCDRLTSQERDALVHQAFRGKRAS